MSCKGVRSVHVLHSKGLKIALVCSGLGYTWRGFERFTLELFNLVRNDLSITLFGCRSNGNTNGVSLPCLKHDRFLAFLKGRKRDNYYFQQLSYVLSFIPVVVTRDYDLIHYSEPTIGNILFRAKQFFGFRYKLLFTDALGLDANLDKKFFDRQDHIQLLTPARYEQMIHAQISSTKITCIPYGICSNQFLIGGNKRALREKYGIPDEKVVILCVAALNRKHKRIDYLIEEVSQLGKDYFLLVVGHAEEPDLIKLGHGLLGDNFKTLYVSFEQVREIYHLADLFVIPSLVEGFCLALAEAMCSGLPVIAHAAPHFEWMVGDRRLLADLEAKGNLAAKIKEAVENYGTFQSIAEKNRARVTEQFDWNHLKEAYLNLYDRVH